MIHSWHRIHQYEYLFFNEISAKKDCSYVYFLLREKKILIGQSTKFFSVKTGFEKLKKSKQNFVKRIFLDPWNFGGSDATNELYFSEKEIVENGVWKNNLPHNQH